MIPQVLLLGNGLNRSFSQTAISWEKLLKNPNDTRIPDKLQMPYGLQVVLRTKDNVNTFVKDFAATLNDEIPDNDYLEKLRNIFSIGFDDILTTNYDFSLEKSALHLDTLDSYRYSRITKHTPGSKRCERKFFLHTYQEVPVDDSHTRKSRIWHIHGHIKNPDSIIIGHYYYGNLLFKYKELVDSVRNQYETHQKAEKEYLLNSWVDSFILGDVYILGLGMDFAEIDLWWLINRKQREHAEHGKIYFYAPREVDGFDEKRELLQAYGVKADNDMGIETFSAHDDETRNMRYKDFYNQAIKDIKKRVNENSCPKRGVL